jgi:chorismate mutase-like protein
MDTTLIKYRDEIDTIDNELLTLFAKRFIVVKNIGEYKKEKGLPIIDKTREEAKLQSLYEKAKAFAIDEAFIKKIWQTLFEKAYTLEK